MMNHGVDIGASLVYRPVDHPLRIARPAPVINWFSRLLELHQIVELHELWTP